jgi:hypothetical protein
MLRSFFSSFQRFHEQERGPKKSKARPVQYSLESNFAALWPRASVANLYKTCK